MKHPLFIVALLLSCLCGFGSTSDDCSLLECSATSGDARQPNPTNCHTFCTCDSGTATVRSCPPGLHFNPFKKTCDTPELAKCHLELPQLTGCENVVCPAENAEFPLHLPNPIDCGSFCKCDWGTPVYFKCPGILHFNPVLQVCDWPDSANCKVTPPPSSTITASIPSEETTIVTTPTSTVKPENGCDYVECPLENGEFAIHLPNPSDCSSFCMCDWGNAIHFVCPPGLHFNPELEVCDWPENANCEEKTTSNPPNSSTTIVSPTIELTTPSTNLNNTTSSPQFSTDLTTPSTNSNDTTSSPQFSTDLTTPSTNLSDTTSTPQFSTEATNGCDYVECPLENGEFAIHLPNPSDCSSFCKCDWGNAIHFDCPPGLHFNPELEVCDWPENANCEEKTTSNPPNSSTTIVSSTTPSTNSNGTTSSPQFSTDLTTPSTNSNDTTSSPQFSTDLTTPSTNLNDTTSSPHFSTDLTTPSINSNDTTSSPQFSTDLTTPSTNLNDTTSSPQFSTEASDGCEYVECPLENGEFAISLPNPSDCSSFCMCDWGNAIHFDCPPSLHFNPELEVCDWPENVNCEDKTTSNPLNSSTTLFSPTAELTTPSTNSNDTTSSPQFSTDLTTPSTNSNDTTSSPQFSTDLTTPSTNLTVPTSEQTTVSTPALTSPITENTPTASSSADFSTITTKEPVSSTSYHSTSSNPENSTQTTNNNSPGDPTGSPPIGCEAVVCPPENGITVLNLPNPSNCGSFCVCNWGEAIEVFCPPGLHFNPVLQVCDWPASANCEVTTLNPTSPSYNLTTTLTTSNFTSTSSTISLTSTTIQTSTTSSSTTTKQPASTTTKQPASTTSKPASTTQQTTTTTEVPNGCDDSLCPPLNEAYAQHFPNTLDCGAFCKCDWGVAVYFQCPPGLHFNAKLQVCDWPESADCDVFGELDTTIKGTESTTEEIFSTEPIFPFSCQTIECGLELIFPNPERNDSFCICVNGNSFDVPCATGMLFDNQRMVCTWPDLVETSSTTMEPTQSPPDEPSTEYTENTTYLTTRLPWFTTSTTPEPSTTTRKPLFTTSTTTTRRPLFTTSTTTTRRPLFTTSTTTTRRPLFTTSTTTTRRPLFTTSTTTTRRPLFTTSTTTTRRPLFTTSTTTTRRPLFTTSTTTTTRRPLFTTSTTTTTRRPLFTTSATTTTRRPLFTTSTTTTRRPLFTTSTTTTRRPLFTTTPLASTTTSTLPPTTTRKPPSTTSTTTTRRPLFTTTPPPPECDDDLCEDDKLPANFHFKAKNVCDGYCVCDDKGGARYFKCPANKQFNIKSGICDDDGECDD